LRVQGSGLDSRLQDLGFGLSGGGSGFRVLGLGFKVSDLGFRV